MPSKKTSLVADVELMRGETPQRALDWLGYTNPGSLAQTLVRHGRPDLARPFWRLNWAARRARHNGQTREVS